MKQFLINFKEEFQNRLIDIHWRQWKCLGIASQLEEEKKWIVDLEALLSSTIFVGQFDKRLISSALDWTFKNREWINTSRFKRIGFSYYRVDEKLNVALVPKNAFKVIENTIKNKNAPNEIKKVREKRDQYNLPPEYRQVFSKRQLRGISTEPQVQKPYLLQLFLRAIFGVNARAEILLYLLFQKEGNSNQIAKTIRFDQKIVYRILEKWTTTGFIDKEMGRKFVLAEKDFFQNLLTRQKDSMKYLDWVKTFHVFARILKSLHTKPWADDPYLLSSFFRHISEETKVIARYANVTLSESSLFKGEEYISPFTKDIMRLLKNL